MYEEEEWTKRTKRSVGLSLLFEKASWLVSQSTV